MASVGLSRVTRPKMLEIATQIGAALVARKKTGGKEPALDDYIGELKDLEKSLATHVDGKTTADAARTARIQTSRRRTTRRSRAR